MCRFLPWGLLILLCAAAVPAEADIYRYVAADGSVHFTNIPTSDRFRMYRKQDGARVSIDDYIRHYARLYRLEEALVRAVIKVESDFDPRAVSRRGAQGLMQLMPATARDMHVADPFDCEENIRGGCRYLRLMLNQFENDLELALAAYNAGPTTIRKHQGIPPYPETLQYVTQVKSYLSQFRRLPTS